MPFGRQHKAGATIIESCIVMILLCLILFSILQVSILTAANEVLVYSASAAMRCATVGYDEAMVTKTARIALLPNMGPKRIESGEEEFRIRSYLAYADNTGRSGVMSYIHEDYWNSVEQDGDVVPDLNDEVLDVALVQHYPMTMPFVGAFYNRDTTELSSEHLDPDREMQMENHSALYLEN
ncbi:pilus assembly protein [Pontiellaceae bacterium B12227]|nr:pilus assembly protein [Pontiellaceae bacterium B12227]